MTKPIGKKILVVPDAHARPDYNNKRFTALGNFIAEKRPDVVISIGDFADMGSLCFYDKGTRASEGRRYQDDIDASRDALAKVMAPVRKAYGRTQLPPFHITLGNHEDRINRAANQNAELYGKLKIEDLGFEEQGWKVHEFLKPFVYAGINFQHYLPSGAMGKPTSGVNHARSLILKGMMSCVVGHSHQRDWYETTKADGTKLFGCVVGCYDQGSHEYAKATEKAWWSGLCMLHEAHAGMAEPAFYSTNYVLRKYS